MAAIGKAAQLLKAGITAARPQLVTIARYAKVELVPPSPRDIPVIRQEIGKIIHSVKTGQYRNVTVREAWLNTLVAIEVICWFYVGECIGKRHLIGYDV